MRSFVTWHQIALVWKILFYLLQSYNIVIYWCMIVLQVKPAGRIRNGEDQMRISEQTCGSMERSAFTWMSWCLMLQNLYGGTGHCLTLLLQTVCFYWSISHPFTTHLLHFITRLLLPQCPNFCHMSNSKKIKDFIFIYMHSSIHFMWFKIVLFPPPLQWRSNNRIEV